MNSRERVFSAFAHVQPDRCPADLQLEATTERTLIQHFHAKSAQELQDIFESDLQFVFPDSTLPSIPVNEDGIWYDHAGRGQRFVDNGFCKYVESVVYPLAYVETVDDLKRYDRWPDAADFDWAHYSEKIGNLHEKRIIKLHLGGLYEIAWGLRGQEQFLIDMALDPDIPHYIMGKLCDYWCDYVHRAMAAAGDQIDLIYTYDDIASQNALIMSPRMLQEFVYPYHKKLNAVIKSYGKKILYHSCGAVSSQIDALKALPIDVLTPLQPLAKGMDHQTIKDIWGNKLCFHGGIDIQELMPHGSPEDVRRVVKETISILGKNGGYILAPGHFLQNDAPIENIIAMYDPSIR